MPNGDDRGLPGPEGGLPDLLQPPAFKEGVSGGPAMPTGGLSASQKAGYAESSENANYYAVGAGAVATVSGAISGGGGALTFGLMSAAFALAGLYFASLAQDPPKPHERIVTFKPRLCSPPGMNDPVLSRGGIAIQRAVFTLVSAHGLLDALERWSSAEQAGDLNWAVTHHGVASQCHQTLVVDTATLASATYAAGQALSGTELDLPLEPASGGMREWIESPGMEAKIWKQMHAGGFLTNEITTTIEWWKTDPKYSGPATTFSRLLLEAGNNLYTSAQKLAL
jgi:hypothetical protein